jgi:hypothetical protein
VTDFPLLLVVLAVLLLGAGALVSSIAAIGGLIAELLGSLFASVRALAVISLLIACVVVVALAGGTGAGGPVG